jgi:hypothetical protein
MVWQGHSEHNGHFLKIACHSEGLLAEVGFTV